MGGNIWKDSVRLDLNSYFNIQEYVVRYLAPFTTTKTISFMQGKETFGDLDIVIDIADKVKVIEFIKRQGHSLSINGDVISFLIHNFQVDLICVPKDRMEYAAAYFSFNDVGNILGRMVKQLGLKHGHLGLFYVHRNDSNDKILSETLVSLDPNLIYDILKIELTTDKVFMTQTDWFDVITKSPYFNKEIYQFNNLNHQNKVRDRKRKTYHDFLTYCENLPNKTVHKFNKQSVACYLFPELIEVIANDKLREEHDKLYKLYFGGDAMSAHFQIKGIELGNFMKYFKSVTDKQELITMLLFNESFEDVTQVLRIKIWDDYNDFL